ncbi:uncharacterized protein Z518_01855 [Rhinocladiella mackenziei CBS 650.93]|uniref:MI domain-containing protein n=1 Tax=Rhinocladiella mackenziei CBS 650.93 TaxID=1442369 RepID=A0A0D2FY26_9EURO|nr:uncharacterized protein Z518_01855 [Rhinocladiella mackenziei CBS 650.93]KIX07202.1 hypothetical protein Z518_01855 [Rhinocladiella mackenziei CBS 650.93]
MPRQNAKPQNGVKLPFALRKELGLESKRPGVRRQYGTVKNRKEERKTKRQEKRQNKRGSKFRNILDVDEDGSTEEELEEDDKGENPSRPRLAERSAAKMDVRTGEPKPKSILKRPRHPSTSLSETSSLPSSRPTSPGLVLDANSRAYKERAAQDDAEISTLEKKLGLKKNKLSKPFADDGLDDLLDGLQEQDRGTKRKNEGKEWLERKRRKVSIGNEEGDEEDAFDLDEESVGEDLDSLNDEEADSEDDLSEVDREDGLDEENSADDDFGPDDGDDFEGFETEEEASPAQPRRVRENPYIAPVSSETPPAKYIPPSLRKAPNSEAPSLGKLKRQIQGHLNKLSEANLVSILGEIEKIYQSNPRQDVTSVLIDLLLTLFSNKSTLQNTFVILHAAFTAAVYKVVGVDFGAEALSQLVDRFEQYHHDTSTGKEALNLISLLSHFFTFHIVGSVIIFDHIRLLLAKLSENNTELLLRLVRDCGPQLRQDDPSSLKAVVQLMQKEVAHMNSAGEQMSVRTKFMIETITDLKNNKMRAATSNTGVSSEHITRMRKVLGSLNSRNLKASEPLRISLDDIKSSDQKGRWWLVGARWKGNEPTTTTTAAADEFINTSARNAPLLDDDADSIDLLALARQYGMNTDVRRSIFVALLSAVDYQDAYMRVLKLRLKRSQEQEIPKVLLRCAAGEKPYNHYYTLVAKKLCLDKRMRKAFQFALWGFFRRLGENPDLEDEYDEQDEQNVVEISEIANLARLFAHLILDGAETVGVLKVLDLAYVKERTMMFVELLFIMVMTEAKDKENSLARVFERVVETPQILKRLQFFIKKNVWKSDLVAKADREVVKRGCKVALETLGRLNMGTSALDD